MRIHYLEIVTREVADGAPGALAETEEPAVRPCWLVDDIEAAVAATPRSV